MADTTRLMAKTSLYQTISVNPASMQLCRLSLHSSPIRISASEAINTVNTNAGDTNAVYAKISALKAQTDCFVGEHANNVLIYDCRRNGVYYQSDTPRPVSIFSVWSLRIASLARVHIKCNEMEIRNTLICSCTYKAVE